MVSGRSGASGAGAGALSAAAGTPGTTGNAGEAAGGAAASGAAVTSGADAGTPADAATTCPNVGIHGPGRHRLFLQGHEAMVLFRVTDWPERILEEPIHDDAQRSDAWLLYPGTPFGMDEPVPSVRLKQLQLGIQE